MTFLRYVLRYFFGRCRAAGCRTRSGRFSYCRDHYRIKSLMEEQQPSYRERHRMGGG